jgi:hypothetical protein
MKIKFIFLIPVFLFPLLMPAQQVPVKSIHQLQSQYYNKFGFSSLAQYDSLNGFQGEKSRKLAIIDTLIKRVFGYFPYWAGDNYLNYRWDLLSDFCYFSYEVNPSTGNPETTHEWETTPAIDTALANNVKVHLCVTLFSDHATFFNSSSAQQTLIDNVIQMLIDRDAIGVNIDFEAMPSAYGDEFSGFIISLSEQLHEAIPGSELSMAAPAVNWSNTFDIPVLKDYLDFFMVMAYDYYWGGSSMAGPVSPQYSMTAAYNYNFSRTISYYQSQGLSNEQMVVGVPYYGREWPVEEQFAPSATTGSGSAYTYRWIRNNTPGYYSNENKHFEPNSFSPYFSFFTDEWNQCFIEDTISLAKKFDLVNRRKFGGIGIWALGYDDGYPDFWDVIANKFTTTSPYVLSDSVFDSGGPSFYYYNSETYTYLIFAPEEMKIELTFDYLNLEADFDTLWIYDGPDENAPLIDFFTGEINPGTIVSSSNELSLKFYSDESTRALGWRAVFQTVQIIDIDEEKPEDSNVLRIWPNPFSKELNVLFVLNEASPVTIEVNNQHGQIVFEKQMGILPAGEHHIQLSMNEAGRIENTMLILKVKTQSGIVARQKIIHL